MKNISVNIKGIIHKLSYSISLTNLVFAMQQQRRGERPCGQDDGGGADEAVDSTHGKVVSESIRLSTHATFNSRVLSIGYLNDRCHNILNLIRNIDINFVPEITQPVDPLLVHMAG